MTHVIQVEGVNQALGEGFQHLKICGEHEPSRNGPVIVAPGPVVTEYTRPQHRVLFNPVRDANPVFHLLEAIWMFAGKQDSKFLLPYNARMAEYAEEDGNIHGAYGYRWRNFFGIDQILEVIMELRQSRSSRRAVMGMWAPAADLRVQKRDLPCNTHIYFDVRDGCLNMTVCCRSNDILWGAYGANAVHFSMLQELIAFGVGAPVGVYRQMSNNFHAYTDLPIVKQFLDSPPFVDSSFEYPMYAPMLQGPETVEEFLMDCANMVKNYGGPFTTRFMQEVVHPLKTAYDVRKAGGEPFGWLQYAQNCDWKLATQEWMVRRENKNVSE